MQRPAQIAIASLVALGCTVPVSATAAPAAVVAPADPSAAVIARMESFHARPFEADLRVEQFTKAHNVRRDESGKLTFDRPGRYRVDFQGGDAIVADNQLLTRFDAKNAGVVQAPIAAAHCPAAFAFALPAGTLDSHMRIQRYDGAMMNAVGMDVLVATPVQPHRTVAKLLLYVQPDGAVPRVLVLAPSGDRVRIDLSHLTRDASVPASFVPPQAPVAFASPSFAQSAFVAAFP